MSHTTLTELPSSFSAGTTVQYRRSLAEFPAPTWTLKLYLAGKSVLSFTAAPSGSDHLVTIAASATDTELIPGVYQWVERVDNGGGGEVYDVSPVGMVVTVTPNIATATAGSMQLWLEKAVELIEARIAGRVVDGAEAESFQIAGRAVSLIPFRELVGMLNILKSQLRAVRAGGQFSRKVLIRFVGTGLRQ
jgi:hypothetical protein